MLDALRLAAIAAPVTLIVAFVGIIWMIGILIPPTYSNCQRTGRQALSMIRVLVPPR